MAEDQHLPEVDPRKRSGKSWKVDDLVVDHHFPHERRQENMLEYRESVFVEKLRASSWLGGVRRSCIACVVCESGYIPLMGSMGQRVNTAIVSTVPKESYHNPNNFNDKYKKKRSTRKTLSNFPKRSKRTPRRIQNKFHTISRSISTEGEQIPGQFRTNSNKTM